MKRYLSYFLIATLGFMSSGVAAEDVNVQIKGFAYTPAIVNVKVGTTVHWVNQDNAPHTVTGNDESWGSDKLRKNDEYSQKFDKAGTFEYFCKYHLSMTGSVIVTP